MICPRVPTFLVLVSSWLGSISIPRQNTKSNMPNRVGDIVIAVNTFHKLRHLPLIVFYVWSMVCIVSSHCKNMSVQMGGLIFWGWRNKSESSILYAHMFPPFWVRYGQTLHPNNVKLRKRQSEHVPTTTVSTAQFTHNLQFNSVNTNSLPPGPTWPIFQWGMAPVLPGSSTSQPTSIFTRLAYLRRHWIAPNVASYHNVAQSWRFHPPADRWGRIHNQQPPLPSTGTISWSEQQRVDGYGAEWLGGNLYCVASNLLATSSFNPTMPPPSILVLNGC